LLTHVAAPNEFLNNICAIQLKMEFDDKITTTGQDFFDRILSAEGLAWIGVKILDQFDV
jgi:hypothetical protein